LTYAGSVSFRELKNAKKKYFFLNLGGVGAKTRFLSKKNWGRILGLAGKNIGSACLIYMGVQLSTTWLNSIVERSALMLLTKGRLQ